MPEKHGLLAAILAAANKATSGQSFAFAMAYLRGRYNGGAFTNSNRRNDVRHYRLVHFVTFSTSPD